MVELQFLNYLLNTGKYDIVIANNINESYFKNYAEEFRFISNHYSKYGNVPDKETFVDKFEDFEFINVKEDIKYLLEALGEENLYNTFVEVFNEIREVLPEDSRKAFNILQNRLPDLTKKIKTNAIDLVADADIRFKEYIEKVKNPFRSYITTGFEELDELIGGWDYKDELAYIVARSNQGKSWWLYYFMLAAAKQGRKVGIYSGEMTASKVGYRIDTFMSNISNFMIGHGRQEISQDYEKHIEEIKKLEGNIYIITPKELGGTATVSSLRNFAEKYDLDMLGIDQISLIEDMRKGRGMTERLTNISMDLKFMQTDLQIPLLIAAQLNRTENEEGGIGLRQIAGADRIGQDATTVLGLVQKEHGIEVKIVKSRDSQVGDTLTYSWNIDKGQFSYIPTSRDKDKKDNKYPEIKKEEFKDKSEDVF